MENGNLSAVNLKCLGLFVLAQAFFFISVARIIGIIYCPDTIRPGCGIFDDVMRL